MEEWMGAVWEAKVKVKIESLSLFVTRTVCSLAMQTSPSL